MTTRTGERPPETPDARLAEALGPTVGTAARRSLRHESRLWAEALTPILLPAVRMAVTSALRDLVTALNHVLEHSLSIKSWQWRLEAWRTGKPFAEIMLLRTLVYRVEHVLLVDRHTGLLLASMSGIGTRPKDPDLVAAMLTAIQDFVRDSFEVDRDAGIREVYFGDLSLIVESGPRAALVAAVRGEPSLELRETLRAAIDLIHQEFETELQDFQGDPQPFERSNSILEDCFQVQFQQPRVPSNTRLWIVATVMVAAIATLLGFHLDHARRWDRAVQALRNNRGIVVTLADRQNGRYLLEGLRDPLAPSPGNVLTNNGIDLGDVSIRFRSYLSLDPDFIAKRIKAALGAPATVSVSVSGDVLRLAGTAPHAWILHAQNALKLLSLAEITGVSTGELVDSDLDALREEIETTNVLFAPDSSAVAFEQAHVAKTLAVKVREWWDDAIGLGAIPRLEVVGYADPSGTKLKNLDLSRLRAEQVAGFLVAEGIDRKAILVRGAGEEAGGATDAAHLRRAVVRANVTRVQPATRSVR